MNGSSPASPSPAGNASTLGSGLRSFLHLTTALTGAAVLVIEILGAKILAPWLGTSHFVWTAQIAVTLVALAAGYALGGRLADRNGSLHRYYNLVLAAGISLALVVWIVEPVALACVRFNLALGALLASALLFFLPLTLLATTVPWLLRTLTASLHNIGGQAGRLSALSTLGSVVGTVLISYVLVPLLPNSVTLYLTASILIGLAVAFRIGWGRALSSPPRTATSTVLLGLLALACGFPAVQASLHPHASQVDVLARVNSNFGELRVVQPRGRTTLYYLNDGLVQNTYDPETRRSQSLFTYMLHDLAQAYTPKLKTALCIGMGVGIVPMQLAADGADVDVLEINAAAPPMARRFFHFDPARVHLHIGDGRPWLNTTPRRYDAVIVDAFLGDSSPSHLLTREAFTAVKRCLNPDGTLVMNTFGEFAQGRDFFSASVDATLRAVFRTVRIHTSGNGNVFCVASDRVPLTILHEPDLGFAPNLIVGQIQAAFNGMRESALTGGRILTDDFNPAEFHDAANRERMRRQLAYFLRDL